MDVIDALLISTIAIGLTIYVWLSTLESRLEKNRVKIIRLRKTKAKRNKRARQRYLNKIRINKMNAIKHSQHRK